MMILLFWVSLKWDHNCFLSVKLIQNPLTAPGEIKKKPKEKRSISSRSNSNQGGFKLISQSKVSHNCFLKRPNFFKLCLVSTFEYREIFRQNEEPVREILPIFYVKLFN